MKLVHQPCAGDVEKITAFEIDDAVNQLILHRDEYQKLLIEAKVELNQKAHDNAKMVKEFIYGGEGIL